MGHGSGINGYENIWDEQAQSHYLWNRSNGNLITYESAMSARLKAEYARDNGLAGVFSWEIDADDGAILDAMRRGLQ